MHCVHSVAQHCSVEVVKLVSVCLSVTIDASHVLPSYWPASFTAITIGAVIAGIILVAILLMLNLTVSIGTLNAWTDTLCQHTFSKQKHTISVSKMSVPYL